MVAAQPKIFFLDLTQTFSSFPQILISAGPIINTMKSIMVLPWDLVKTWINRLIIMKLTYTTSLVTFVNYTLCCDLKLVAIYVFFLNKKS